MPTVCPSDHEEVLEAVAAPRKFQPTADCTKTVKEVKEQPMPKPMTIMIPTKYGFLSYNDIVYNANLIIEKIEHKFQDKKQ